jgi:hypothetical protein
MPDYSEEQICKLRGDYTAGIITGAIARIKNFVRNSRSKNKSVVDLFKSACGYDLELAQWVFNTFKLSRKQVWHQYSNALYHACKSNKIDVVKWLTTDLRRLPLNKNKFYFGIAASLALSTAMAIALSWSFVRAGMPYLIIGVALAFGVLMFLLTIMFSIELDKLSKEYSDDAIQDIVNCAFYPALLTENFELIEHMANLYQGENSFRDEMFALIKHKKSDAILFLLTRFDVDENTILQILVHPHADNEVLKHILSSRPKYEDGALLSYCEFNEEMAMWLIDRCAGNEGKKAVAARAVNRSCEHGNIRLAEYIVAKFGLVTDDCISDQIKHVFGSLGPKCASFIGKGL